MITVFLLSLVLPAQADGVSVGPRSGALVIVGGGPIGREISDAFVALAGGVDSEFVSIPTADEESQIDPIREEAGFRRQFGVENVTVLHTRDRSRADSEAFVAPLLQARGVWFGGGRQWRLVDAYLGTRTQRELEAVLARGGVIGGTSAGATIQGSYLVRGAREGNQIMMAKGYEEGFGYLHGVAVDQHLLTRLRLEDLAGVVAARPGLLGLGIDEATALVVRGDRFSVIGRSVAAVYDGHDHDGRSYFLLGPGEQFDLRIKRRVPRGQEIRLLPAETDRKPVSRPAYSKVKLEAAVRARADSSWQMAQQIWDWAEVGYHETRSAELLAGALAAGGFRVERGMAGIPTAFTATIGHGKPVIAILGEYDALPGLSQQAVPERQPRPGVSAGHGCGHHLLGVASAAACLALAEPLRSGALEGTLRYYGCPAEEGGSAKAFMVRAGLFGGCDAVLHWHPASQNVAGAESSQARIAAKFRFHGVSSHAAGSPEVGRSALDAVDLTDHAAELLREHTPDFTRIHHVITAGGGAPNVVPDFAEVYYYIRHPRSDVVRKLFPRLLKCAEAAAMATETRLETLYEGGILELVPSESLGRAVRANLVRLSDLRYDAAEREFAGRIRQTLTDPPPLERLNVIAERRSQGGTGSTDVGDVSWVVPTAGFTTACWVPGTPGHSWQAVAAGGTTIGRKGMMLAAGVLAASACDLLQSPEILRAARAELTRRSAGRPYMSLLGADQKPPLHYRDRPARAQ
jgi:aminobenzoyl-glutamate utilization protein B